MTNMAASKQELDAANTMTLVAGGFLQQMILCGGMFFFPAAMVDDVCVTAALSSARRWTSAAT